MKSSKFNKYVCYFLVLILACINTLYAGNYKAEKSIVTAEMKSKLESKLLEVQLGNEYLVIVPPNDRAMGTYLCELYVGSREPCTIYIEQPKGEGLLGTLNITKPYSIEKYLLSRDLEVRGKFENPENLALRVWSDKPIMVYLGSYVNTSGEGYMVLPVNALGTKYVHCSWKSNQESSHDDSYHTGFVVGATQDGTKVQVKLRGKNLNEKSGCVTDGSLHPIGSTYFLQDMDAWQVINVWDEMIEAENTRGKCDFTGTTISANKPIAVFSYHERTDIPIGMNNRDNLVEQLLPVNMWGKQYISLQLRCKNAIPNPQGEADAIDKDLLVGDYFRVVAVEDSTILDVTWWHSVTGELIKELKNQVLDGEGSFWDWNENPLFPRKAGDLGIQGVALFKANKPIQVMQYCFSTGYGQIGGNFDPLMVIVPPIEQYGYETILQTSSYIEMAEHYFNLIAKGNANDENDNLEKLSSINISENGGSYKPVVEHAQSFLHNNIPGTDYYYIGLDVNTASTYAVKSKTKVAGTVFGFGKVISYGWPASMALVETSERDTLYPQIRQISGCVDSKDKANLNGIPDRKNQQGRYKFLTYYADTTNYPATDNFSDPQVDLGLSYAPRLVIPDGLTLEEKEMFENFEVYKYHFFKPVAPSSDVWDVTGPVYNGAVEFNVVDIYKDAVGFVSYRDRAGNETIDTMIYIADNIKFYNDNDEIISTVDFGTGKVAGKTYTYKVKLKNISNKDVHIEQLFLTGSNNNVYSITKGSSNNITLGSQQEHELEITYKPISGSSVDDTLRIYTECLQFAIKVTGSSGISKIDVSNVDFGQVLVNNKVYTNASGNDAVIRITNNGTEDLLITNYHFEPAQNPTTGPFFFEPAPEIGSPSQSSPWVIAKNGGTKDIKAIAFLPTTRDNYEVKIIFESNAADASLDPNNKNYSIIKGEGIQPGPQVTSHNWDEVRVKTINKAKVRLKNSGNTSLTVKEISNNKNNWVKDNNGNLVSPDGSYKVLNVDKYVNNVVYPEDGNQEPKYIDIEVEFEPLSEYTPYGTTPISTLFYINFDKANGIEDNSVYCLLEGHAVLPKIEVKGYSFPHTKLGETCEESGRIVIRNISETAKLYIKSIVLDPNDQASDFTISNPRLDSYDGSYLDINDSIEFRVVFKPMSLSPLERTARVLVQNDAEEGPEEEPIITTEILLKGKVFNDGFDYSPAIDYGTVTRCFDTISQFVVVNLNTANGLEIDSVVVDPDKLYPNVFELMDKSFPVTVKPEGRQNIRIRFVADRTTETGDIATTVLVYTSAGMAVVDLKAKIVVIPVSFAMDTIENRSVGENISMPFKISMLTSNPFYKYENAKINQVDFTISVTPSQLRVVGINGNNGWNFSIVDADYTNGKIKVSGTGNILNKDDIICNLQLKILASNLQKYPLEIEDISFGDRSSCVIADGTCKGLISYTSCVEDLIEIRVNDEAFNLAPITPNPVIDNNLTINYSLGLDCNVSINIFNSEGKLVNNLVSESQKAGKYTKNIDVSELASGTYIITMKTGVFETKQSFVIVK